jgi:hypothetical protein
VAAARGDGGGDAIVAYPSTERWVAEAGGPGHESASRYDRRRSGPTGDESWLVEYERGSGGRSSRSASTPPPRRRVEVEEEAEDDHDSGSFDFDGNL